MAAAVIERVEIRLTEGKLERGESYWVRDVRDPDHPSVLAGRYTGTEFERFVVFIERTGYPFDVLTEDVRSGRVGVYTYGGYLLSQIAGEWGDIPPDANKAIELSRLLREPLDDKGVKAINTFYSKRGL